MTVELIHVFPSFAPGGIQMRLRTLVQGLPDHWTHSVLALDGIYSALDKPGWPANINAVDTPPVIARNSGMIGRVRAVKRWLSARACDGLITNNWGAMEWACAAGLMGGLAHIHTESGFGPDEAFKLNGKRGLFRRLVLRRADAILMCSQTLVAIAQEQWHLPSARVHFVPDGIDLQRFSTAATQAMQLGQGADKIVIGCVAPLRAEKNLKALLEAFNQAWLKNKRLHLAIAGDGPERSTLEAYANTLPAAKDICFHGFIDQIEAFFASTHICALSSDTEQLPNSILQAMAMELPIAAFAVGDIALMVADENAPFLPARRDVDGLAQAFFDLADDGNLRGTLGQANRRKCSQYYAQEHMVQAYTNVIQTALLKRNKAAA